MGDVKSLRLSEEEIKAIRETAREIFGEKAKVWIFGSRTDPSLRGGDIDIYIEMPNAEHWLDKKLDFLVKLKDKIGEQKIDVIVRNENCEDPFCEKIKKTGVKI